MKYKSYAIDLRTGLHTHSHVSCVVKAAFICALHVVSQKKSFILASADFSRTYVGSFTSINELPTGHVMATEIHSFWGNCMKLNTSSFALYHL